MSNTCKILNEVLRDIQKYDELEKMSKCMKYMNYTNYVRNLIIRRYECFRV